MAHEQQIQQPKAKKWSSDMLLKKVTDQGIKYNHYIPHRIFCIEFLQSHAKVTSQNL